MRTTIEIDDALMADALKHYATKKEAVEEALKTAARLRKQASFRDMWGTGGLDPDYDYKKMREARFPDWQK